MQAIKQGDFSKELKKKLKLNDKLYIQIIN